MVKTLPSNAGGEGSTPGPGAKIPHASGPKNKKQTNKKTRSNIVTNSIKTLKKWSTSKTKNLRKNYFKKSHCMF